jgi:hypothetical protein
MARAVRLLPEPLSPMMPSRSAGPSVTAHPSTTRFGRPKAHRQPFHFKQRHGCSLALEAGIDEVAQPVAGEVQSEMTMKHDGKARDQRQPWGWMRKRLCASRSMSPRLVPGGWVPSPT